MRRFSPLLAVLLQLAAGAGARAEVLYMVQGTQLFAVDTADVPSFPGGATLTGLKSNDGLIGVDFRPSTGQLYGVGTLGYLYRLDLRRLQATAVSETPTLPAVAGGAGAIDFDPVRDRLRVILPVPDGRHFLVDPDTAQVSEATKLAYAAGDPHAADPARVTTIAHTANVAGASATTVYGIDTDLGVLVRIGGVDGTPSPDGGVVTTIGPLGVMPDDQYQTLDISGASGTAYALIDSGAGYNLYRVNLATGAATLLGRPGYQVAVRGGKLAGNADVPGYRVRAFPELSAADGSTGDREPSGAYWFVSGAYDGTTVVKVHRLEPGGALTSYAVDGPVAVYSAALRRDPASGAIWTLVTRADAASANLYRLDAATGEVRRYTLPFRAYSLALDPVDQTPWLGGGGKLAFLSQDVLTTYAIPQMNGKVSRFDGSRRLWLASDQQERILSFSPNGTRLDSYVDPGGAWGPLDLDQSGALWGHSPANNVLARFDPRTRARTRYPTPYTSTTWDRAGVTASIVTLVSGVGPHLLAHRNGHLPDGVTETLAEPTSTQPAVSAAPLAPALLTAARESRTLPFVERVVYAEEAAGRRLFTADGSDYDALVESTGGELLTSGDPMQWWRPLPPHEGFTTTAALPVAVEVRPDSPDTNFLTELTLTNLDAEGSVVLTYRTSDAEYLVTLSVPTGTTQVFPNVIQKMKELGAAIPAGSTAGTLTATFRNGSGRLAARVYTRFPNGSTTGLGYTSLDPTAGLFAFRKSLNGLKQTADFRTNVAVSNLCGTLEICTDLEITANFFDDATGQRVGEVNLIVPPNQWRQTDVPLAGLGATGETFSVLFVPYSTGVKAYDAYATVIDNTSGDASFLRASAVGASSRLVLPVATDAAGVNTRFTSEAAITNTSGGDAVADVTFISARSGEKVTEVLTLGDGRGVLYKNAVAHFRALAPARVMDDDYGPISIAFRDSATGFASSRTVASNGTGLGFTALGPNRELPAGRKRILGVKETEAFRTNLAVVNLGETRLNTSSIRLRVTFRDAAGQSVGRPLTVRLNPGELFQWNRVLDAIGASEPPRGEGYVALIERTEGRDAFDAYITVIDNGSSDPTFVRAE